MRLIEFRKNIYSQNGEDGVIEEILQRLAHLYQPGVVVEFGAWDGMHLSNTYNLVENFNFSAVYIEGDPDKFIDLQKTALIQSRITPVCAMLSSTGMGDTKTLDSILSELGISEVTLLSIDIDSIDLEIWASSVVDAKIVVIEINSSIEPGIIRWNNPPRNTGNSFSATLQVAVRKGYSLVCHTGNMIFVRSDLVGDLKLDSLDLEYPERLFLTNWLGLRPSLKEVLLRSLTRVPAKYKRQIRNVMGMKSVNYDT